MSRQVLDQAMMETEVAHDLMPSAQALLTRSLALLGELDQNSAAVELREDLRKVCESVHRLLEALRGTTAEHGRPETRAQARHLLATPLNHVIGYCELWIDEDDPRLARQTDELVMIRSLAWRLLYRISLLLEQNTEAQAPES